METIYTMYKRNCGISIKNWNKERNVGVFNIHKKHDRKDESIYENP